MSLAEMCGVPGSLLLPGCLIPDRGRRMLYFGCCCVIPCICIPPLAALLCFMVAQSTGVPQCLQELRIFLNAVTGSCVLEDFSKALDFKG